MNCNAGSKAEGCSRERAAAVMAGSVQDAPATSPTPAWGRILPGALITLLSCAAYANTFRVPFLFDDKPAILENPTLRSLRHALSPPGQFGVTVAGRPLLNLSLAINYAISGFDSWSYHLFNLLFHTSAALLLYGVVRRTLELPAVEARLRSRATLVATTVALLWAVHPLQTESVTYVIQRAESLMGMFYLLTFYAAIRSFTSFRPRPWWILAVLSCGLGAATKEVIVTAPVLILLYDRAFVAGSIRQAWRERRGLYLGLATSWMGLVVLVGSAGGNRGGTFSYTWGYALTYWSGQTEAIVRYLKLSLWPHPLVFENGLARTPEGWRLPVYAGAVALLVIGTLVATWKRPQFGFLGAWFFIILAPTSLLPGITQSIVEHRMYLSLAAVITGVACLAVFKFGRAGLLALLLLAPIAAYGTARRNAVYRNEQRLWEDTLIYAPGSANAHGSLGTVLFSQGRFEEAARHYQASIEFDPAQPGNHYNLGLALIELGRLDDALAEFARCIGLNPLYYPAHYRSALVLRKLGRPVEAGRELRAALESQPGEARLHELLGMLAADAEAWTEALNEFGQAARLDPALPGAILGCGVAQYQLRHYLEAERWLRQLSGAAPEVAKAAFYLGLVNAARGDLSAARAEYEKALGLDPLLSEAQLNLGVILAQERNFTDALPHLEAAARLAPRDAKAHENLANVLLEIGRADQAIEHYRTSLELDASNPLVHYNLGNALLGLRRLEEAQQHFAEAARLDPKQTAAAELAIKLRDYLANPFR